MNIDVLDSEQAQGIKKATINPTDDLDDVNAGGALNPIQGRDFFNRVKNKMVMNRHATIVPMTGNGVEMSHLNIDGRVLERDNNLPSTKRSIDTGEIALNGKRIKAAFKVTRSFFEQNIEGEAVLGKLVDAFSRMVANGCEKMLWISNTLGHAVKQSEFNNDRDNVGSTSQYVRDDLFNLFNGMIYQAVTTGSQVNAAGSSDIRKLVTMAKKEMHPDFREDTSRLRIFMPLNIVENLRFALSNRTTPLGDMSVTEEGVLKIAGIPVVGVPLLDNNPKYVEHITLGNTSTARPLKFGYLDQDDVIVTPTGLSTTATSAYGLTSDYVIHETNGTITAAGSTTPNTTVKVTYQTPPLFILTVWDNILFGLNEDFRVGMQEDVDTDTLLVVIRTRIDFKYRDDRAVVIVKNIQDAL